MVSYVRVLFLFVQILKAQVESLKASVALLTKPSVDAILKRLMSYVSRPLQEFNTFEALEMLDTLQTTAQDMKHQKAGFYKMAFQTARSKAELPKEQFHHLVMRLIGNKDLEKTLDILAKVEKAFKQSDTSANHESRPAPYRKPQDSGARAPRPGTRCFYCQKIGHVRANCFKKKRDEENQVVNNSAKD